MDDAAFDEAMVAGAMALAAREGWRAVTVPRVAREAGLPLRRARIRFCRRHLLLVRLGRLADAHALASVPKEGSIRDRLFDLLMRRFDYLNRHRDGVRAVLRDPLAVAFMVPVARNSMRWMLEAAEGDARGLRGHLRVKGLLAVWGWAVRAWRSDDSEDLAHTMAELDKALDRADQAARSLGSGDAAADEQFAGETPSQGDAGGK